MWKVKSNSNVSDIIDTKPYLWTGENSQVYLHLNEVSGFI
jgi:hypothetical protein